MTVRHGIKTIVAIEGFDDGTGVKAISASMDDETRNVTLTFGDAHITLSRRTAWHLRRAMSYLLDDPAVAL